MSLSPREAEPEILLVDNGSLEPAATLNLRRIAFRLGQELGRPVVPVSLLHSSAIPAASLDGQPAEILEPVLERRLQAGIGDFLVVPLFFGPSGALTDYLPRRVKSLQGKFPQLRLRLSLPLINMTDAADQRVAEIVADHVRRVLTHPNAAAADQDGSAPAVILVDHGSPTYAVAQIRDQVAMQLRDRLGSSVRAVIAASMERRPGAEYDFCEPLLERAFDLPGFDAGIVVVAMLFLSPGRHAGAGGDVARICAAARLRHPQLRLIMTDLVGSHPGLIPILVDRARAGMIRAAL